MSTGVLLRRHLGAPWLKPMAKIGATGSDEYVLSPLPSLAWEIIPGKPPGKSSVDTCSQTRAEVTKVSPQDRMFTAELVARSSGELFLYLNDAIFLPLKTRLFYCNNEGSGRITVERVVPAPL